MSVAEAPAPLLPGQIPAFPAEVVDLYDGAGGWQVAARALGVTGVVGIEWDIDAVLTTHAAGFDSILGDIPTIEPRAVADVGCGLIASPPCQTFSTAGGQAGRALLDIIVSKVRAWGGQPHNRELAAKSGEMIDDRSAHVLEVARWIDDLQPRWIALEQVPAVLPVWEAYVDALRFRGYSAWCGDLSAERFGVPQTRTRAILVASLDRDVTAPPATHARYITPRKGPGGMDSLFGDATPAPDRIVLPVDRDLLPWVSMADALGWGDGEVGFPRLEDDGEYRERDLRSTSEPAFALTAKARSWARRPSDVTFVQSAQSNATRRGADEPAPTITAGHDSGERRWEPTHYNARDQADGRTGRPNRKRDLSEPAPTIAGESRNDSWISDQPTAAAERPAAAIRVSVAEAAVLQSFPAGFPWQGSRTSQFRQVGNAIPPRLAAHVLSMATGQPLPTFLDAQEAITHE